jgi:hypothetical protein
MSVVHICLLTFSALAQGDRHTPVAMHCSRAAAGHWLKRLRLRPLTCQLSEGAGTAVAVCRAAAFCLRRWTVGQYK